MVPENTAKLGAACARNELSEVQRILKMPATQFDVNGKSKSGFAPIHFAADNDHFGVVKKLVKAEGIDVNLPGGVHDNTALHMASYKGYVKTVKELIAAPGINFELKNKVIKKF